MTRDLEGIAGKEMLVLVVEYPPGGVSPPHRHDASVFVYVLEGAVEEYQTPPRLPAWLRRRLGKDDEPRVSLALLRAVRG